MTFHLTPKDTRDRCQKWLLLWQGMLGVSEREKDVLVELLVQYEEYKSKVLDERLLWEQVLGTTSRKQMQEALGITRFALGNYLTAFRQAGLLISSKGYEQLLPTLLPQPEFIVYFK